MFKIFNSMHGATASYSKNIFASRNIYFFRGEGLKLKSATLKQIDLVQAELPNAFHDEANPIGGFYVWVAYFHKKTMRPYGIFWL